MISLLLLAAHMLGDYITQTGWMAADKLINWKARVVHVTVYTAGFVPIAYLCGLAPARFAAFIGAVWVTHFITDCRRWASGEQWPPKPILVDQSIHIITLAVLGVLFSLK